MKLLLGLLILIVVGCVDDSTLPDNDPIVESVRPTVVFLQASDFEGETTSMNAELRGELVIKNNCIRIDSIDQDISYLPVWPSNFNVEFRDNKIRIVDENDGEIVASVEDNIHLSGGELPTLSQQLQAKLPDNCPGPFWSVGKDITVIP